MNAMQDAVVLANCLHDLESTSPEAIHACFADFRGQRYAHVKEQYEASQMNAKLIYGQVKCMLLMLCPPSPTMQNCWIPPTTIWANNFF